jgi:hypothetical protein
MLRLQKRRLVRQIAEKAAEGSQVRAVSGWDGASSAEEGIAAPPREMAAWARLVHAITEQTGRLAQRGAVLGATWGVLLGVALAVLAAVRRGWIPDAGTTAAVAAVGAAAFALAGGFLGAVAGGTGGVAVAAVRAAWGGGRGPPRHAASRACSRA